MFPVAFLVFVFLMILVYVVSDREDPPKTEELKVSNSTDINKSDNYIIVQKGDKPDNNW